MINDLEDLKVDTCQVDVDGKTLETFNVPDADGQAVAGSCREDLDEELVSRYIAAVRETTPRLVNENDTDVLYYTGVVADRAGTELTVAGLYALGEYPQRLLPHLTLTAAVEGRGDERAVNRRDFTGALPVIPDGDLTWLGGLGSILGLNQNQKKAHRLTPADRDSTRGRRETMWLKGRGN